jgi:hypothetical protein
MNNLLPPHRDIHSMFDLKGSTIGRDYSEEKLKQVLESKPRLQPTLKDLNWLRRDMKVSTSPGPHPACDQAGRDWTQVLADWLRLVSTSLTPLIQDNC